MVIFKHNLQRMLSLRKILVYFLIFIPVFYFLVHTFNSMFYLKTTITTNSIVNKNVASFFLVTFLLSLGVPFLISIVGRGTALIQQEVDDDTLIILISKPIERSKIFFEKWLATFVATAIMSVLSIFLSLTLYIILFSIDTLILQIFVSYLPSLLIYALIINLIYNSISIMAVTIFKHRIVSVIILIMLIMIFQLILPFLKPTLLASGVYTKYYLYIFDTNYQFGLLLFGLISLFSTLQFTPFVQDKLTQYIGIFDVNSYAVDPELGFIPLDYSPSQFLSPGLIFIFWFLIAVVFMYLAYFVFKKKDIN